MDFNDIGKLLSNDQRAKLDENIKQSSTIQMPRIENGINKSSTGFNHKANSESCKVKLKIIRI